MMFENMHACCNINSSQAYRIIERDIQNEIEESMAELFNKLQLFILDLTIEI